MDEVLELYNQLRAKYFFLSIGERELLTKSMAIDDSAPKERIMKAIEVADKLLGNRG